MEEHAVKASHAAEVSQVHRGQRRSSIETEPRTLDEEQMLEAKNAAVDILQTKDPQEAFEIFTTPSEDVKNHHAVDQSNEDSELQAIEAHINLLVDKSQKVMEANQKQSKALPKISLSGTSSAPF